MQSFGSIFAWYGTNLYTCSISYREKCIMNMGIISNLPKSLGSLGGSEEACSVPENRKKIH